MNMPCVRTHLASFPSRFYLPPPVYPHDHLQGRHRFSRSGVLTYTTEAHLPPVSSMSQRVSPVPEKVPLDPDGSEGAGVHDHRRTFYPSLRGTECGLYSRFANRYLAPEDSESTPRSVDVQY